MTPSFLKDEVPGNSGPIQSVDRIERLGVAVTLLIHIGIKIAFVLHGLRYQAESVIGNRKHPASHRRPHAMTESPQPRGEIGDFFGDNQEVDDSTNLFASV